MSDKAIYHCPCCDYVTHFPKALEAHQSFRNHYAKAEPVKAEEPVVVSAIEPEEQKKTKKPRKAEKE